MEYIHEHGEIVRDLLGGKFLLYGEEFYDKVAENLEFYMEFFEKSFGYEMVKTTDAIYLSSRDTNESFSQRLMLILAVLVDFLNQEGKDLHEELFARYEVKELENIINNSSHKKVCRKIEILPFIKNSCQKRNIVTYDNEDDSFVFTGAINIFLDFARSVVKKSKS